MTETSSDPRGSMTGGPHHGDTDNPLDAMRIVGFDLGHGETAAATCFAMGNQAPETLEILPNQRVVLSVVVRDGQGTVHIGEDALEADETGGAESHVRFKSRHLDDPKTRLPVLWFVGEAVRRLCDQDPAFGQGAGVTRYIVGCPSAWTAEERSAYRILLESAGMEDVHIISESRAAFVYAYESDELRLTRQELRSDILIIDVGSSTTDFTFMRNLRETVIDFGHNALGAGLFDGILSRYFIDQHGNKKRLRTLFEKHPLLEHRFEIHCRRLKEAYFSGRTARKPHYIETEPAIRIEADLTDALMDNLLATPLTQLDDRSWPQAFEDQLRSVRKKIGDADPGFILLTGGASRMGLIRERTEEVFPTSRIKRGAEPEMTIAAGLALAGRIQVKAERMLQDVDAVAAPGASVDQVVERHVPALFEHLAKALAEAITSDVLQPETLAWGAEKDGSLEDLGRRIGAAAARWNNSAQARAAVRRATNDWFATIQGDIREETDPIAERYGLSGQALALPTDDFVDTMPEVEAAMPGLEGLDIIGALIFSILTIVGLISLTHPVAMPVFVVAAVIAYIGGAAVTERLRKYLEGQNLPGIVRRNLASMLRSRMGEGERKLAQTIITDMTAAYVAAQNAQSENAQSESNATGEGTKGAGTAVALPLPAVEDDESLPVQERDRQMAQARLGAALVGMRRAILGAIAQSLRATAEEATHILR